MFETLSKVSWCDAHTAYHPFDDVAVVAKQASWGAAVVAVVGSNLLPIKWTGANSAAPVLQSQHCFSGRSVHTRSGFSLTIRAGLQLLRRVARNGSGALCSIARTFKSILSLFNVRLFPIGFALVLSLLIAGALSFALAFQIGLSPSLMVGLVLSPLFLGAVALLHHRTRNCFWGMMLPSARLSNARHVNP